VRAISLMDLFTTCFQAGPGCALALVMVITTYAFTYLVLFILLQYSFHLGLSRVKFWSLIPWDVLLILVIWIWIWFGHLDLDGSRYLDLDLVRSFGFGCSPSMSEVLVLHVHVSKYCIITTQSSPRNLGWALDSRYLDLDLVRSFGFGCSPSMGMTACTLCPTGYISLPNRTGCTNTLTAIFQLMGNLAHCSSGAQRLATS
jgi:hypothetical protein